MTVILWLWMAVLCWLHVGLVWNDRYEGRFGLVTFAVVINGLLHLIFIAAWSGIEFLQIDGRVWLGLAGLSFLFSAWEAGRALRTTRRENIPTRNPIEKKALIWVGISVYVFQLVYLGPSLTAAILTGLRNLP